MNFIKTIMMCVLLTPSLCWGGKGDGLLGALNHVRVPLAKASQAGALCGLNHMGFPARPFHARQYHGSAVLLKAAPPKGKSIERLRDERAERAERTLLALGEAKLSFMSRQKKPIHPDPVGEDSTSSASLPERTKVTKVSLDGALREQTLEIEFLKKRVGILEANLQTEIDRNREGEDQLSPLEMIGVSTGIVAGGCAGLGMVCLMINWFSA